MSEVNNKYTQRIHDVINQELLSVNSELIDSNLDHQSTARGQLNRAVRRLQQIATEMQRNVFEVPGTFVDAEVIIVERHIKS